MDYIPLKLLKILVEDEGFVLSRQKLRYWRIHGVFSASVKTESGRYLYGFQDIIALRTIKKLMEHGFTTYQIRNAFESLRKKFPEVANPFVQKPVIVSGNRIAIINTDKVYDALSGQCLLIDLKEIELWLDDLIKDEQNLFVTTKKMKEKLKEESA